MFGTSKGILAALAATLGLNTVQRPVDVGYNHATGQFCRVVSKGNGGKKSGTAQQKREARRRRNIRKQSKK
jgi:hypothetical protein